MVKVFAFDLDGTLLPMDQDIFTNAYFSGLVKKLIPYGYEKESVISAVWSGVKAMILNDGTRLNEEAFWEKFSEIMKRVNRELPNRLKKMNIN